MFKKTKKASNWHLLTRKIISFLYYNTKNESRGIEHGKKQQNILYFVIKKQELI